METEYRSLYRQLTAHVCSPDSQFQKRQASGNQKLFLPWKAKPDLTRAY